MKKILMPALLWLCLPAFVQAQEPAPVSAFGEQVDVHVVNVEVWVTDKKGNPVTDLKREDFQITLGGRAVAVSNFYAEVDGRPSASAQAAAQAQGGTAALDPLELPPEQSLRVIIFIDNTHIRPPNRKKVFKALRTFLDANLAPGDSALIAGLSPTLRIYSDFISDRKAINAVLDKVENTSGSDMTTELERRRVFSELSRQETSATRGESINAAYMAPSLLASIRNYAQQEYDRGRTTVRVLGAFTDTLAGVPGRKALLLVSDGIPTNPGEDLFTAWATTFFYNEIVDGGVATGQVEYNQEVGNFDLLPHFQELGRRANSAQVTFYPIDAEGDGPNRVRSAALEGGVPAQVLSIAENSYREPMELVALRTGGRRFTGRPQLAQELDRLAQDFNAYYSLGITVDGASNEPLPIKVEVGRKDLRVRHRQDVLPRNLDTRSADTTFAALLFNETPNPLEVRAERGPAQRRDDGKWVIPVDVEIPIDHLELVPDGDVFNLQLSLFVSVRAKDGSTRPVQKIPFHLSIPKEHIADARSKPARYTLPLVTEDGDQQVAITVRDDFGFREGAVRLDLQPAQRVAGR